MIQPHPPPSLIILTLCAKYHYEIPYNRQFPVSGAPQQEHLRNKTHAKMLCNV